MIILHKGVDGRLEDNQEEGDDQEEGGEATPGRKNWASSKPLVIQNPVSAFD